VLLVFLSCYLNLQLAKKGAEVSALEQERSRQATLAEELAQCKKQLRESADQLQAAATAHKAKVAALEVSGCKHRLACFFITQTERAL
jgi:hypothetical protein